MPCNNISAGIIVELIDFPPENRKHEMLVGDFMSKGFLTPCGVVVNAKVVELKNLLFLVGTFLMRKEVEKQES